MSAVRTARAVQALGSVALLAVAIALGAGPADAKTNPPTPFTSTKIVVQKSIGGITLGSTQAKAGKGFPKKNCQPGGCTFGGGSGQATYSIYFQTAATSPHATAHVATISLTSDGFAPAVLKLKTSKGIGIGSTVHQLTKAYPKLKGSATDGYYLGSGAHVTTFDADKGRIDSIGMRNQHLG